MAVRVILIIASVLIVIMVVVMMVVGYLVFDEGREGMHPR